MLSDPAVINNFAPAAAMFVGLVLMIGTVLFHYEALVLLGLGIRRITRYHRYALVLCVLGITLIHTLEITFYAVVYWLAIHFSDEALFSGGDIHHLIDCLYFSAETYATLGYGDIVPVRWLRTLVAVEPYNGVLLLSWSGTFMFTYAQGRLNAAVGDMIFEQDIDNDAMPGANIDQTGQDV